MSEQIKKYLGIDFGSKRIGLALADEQNQIATPFEVYENEGNDIIRKIIDLCLRENIKKIIVGIPLNFKTEKTQQSLEVEKFIRELEGAVSCPVEVENEIFTSKISERNKNKKIDSSSAALILQSWLDRKSKI
jgi:putative Holliday junction resolvase